FRLIRDRAVVNRLGFNNAGHAAALQRLEARAKAGRGGIVGVNIGANKDSSDRTGDYVRGLETFYDVASYFTVNISSPNTPGLRDLQAPAALDELVSRVMTARAEKIARGGISRPIVVKIAPDVAVEDLPEIANRLLAHKVDMIAVSNTTLSRHGIKDQKGGEQMGGLSGRPLFHRSTVMLAKVHQATEGKVPLIGVGGIDSGATALAKMQAGASLIQLYTGMVYEGGSVIVRIKRHLAEHVRNKGLKSIGDVVGAQAADWARRPLEAG
ncbi:MAG: dihydroorotate dehydrogenase (quinone), partial [Hyphomicrobiaceae bacterium]